MRIVQRWSRVEFELAYSSLEIPRTGLASLFVRDEEVVAFEQKRFDNAEKGSTFLFRSIITVRDPIVCTTPNPGISTSN